MTASGLPELLRPLPAETSGATLLWSLLAATLLHGALLFWFPVGGWHPAPIPVPVPELALEILILPEQRQRLAPETAQLLAQRDHLGDAPQGDSSLTVEDGAPRQQQTRPEPSRLLGDQDTRLPDDPVVMDPEPLPQPLDAPATPAGGPVRPPLDWTPSAARLLSLQEQVQAPASLADWQPPAPPDPQPAALEDMLEAVPDAGQILATRGEEIARLTASLEARSAAYASRVRRRSVSASTREYHYASYLAAWARKVERIGNLNYPSAAREQRLFGNLILHVAVNADGSIEQVRVVRSSGHEVLDQAAVQIVHLAAPYSPFPPDIAAETDVLDIVRTWQFQRGGSLGWGE